RGATAGLTKRILYDTLYCIRGWMIDVRLTEVPVFFYRTAGGVEPVLDWLRSLPPEDRRAIGIDLSTVQFGWPVGMPLCRPRGGRVVGGPNLSRDNLGEKPRQSG